MSNENLTHPVTKQHGSQKEDSERDSLEMARRRENELSRPVLLRELAEELEKEPPSELETIQQREETITTFRNEAEKMERAIDVQVGAKLPSGS